MLVWSMQPIEVYNLLQKEKILYNNKTSESFIDDFGVDVIFRNAYNWMAEQMKLKIGGPPNGVNYPFWAWHTRNWVHKNPDLREMGYGYRGEKSVCLELDIPNDDILLSDEQYWHYVLNDCYFGESQTDDEYERESLWLNSKTVEEQRSIISKSWEKVFNIQRYRSKWDKSSLYIQATFWALRLDQVKDVRYFTAK